MAQGEPTPEHVVAEFRARYIYSGNASAVARELDIEERTGRRLAERLEDDPTFAEDVRKLHARVAWKHTAMRLRVAEKALERFEGELPELAPSADGVAPVVIDKRADYGRLVLEAEKNSHNLAKLESGSGDEQSGTTEVHIHLAPDADGNGEPKT